MEISCAEIEPIADRFNDQELQSWALQRISHLLSTEPGNCLNELRQIAEWVRRKHPDWIEKDGYWAEFVRINSQVMRSGGWRRLLGL